MPLSRSAKPKPDTQGYYLACCAADLGPEQMRTVEIAGEVVIVTKIEEELHAFSAVCPHASGDLRKSEIYRGRIDCPDHGYRFDIRSGRVLWPPDEVCRLRRYEVVHIDGQIKVRPIRV